MSPSFRPRTVEEPVDLIDGSIGPAPIKADRRKIWRTVAGLVAVFAVLLGAYFVPLPSIGRVRDWSDSVGPWFVVLFFAVNAIAIIGPIPRSAFTVMSGLLFGPIIGFTGSMVVAAIAVVVAFAAARRLGRERVQRYLDQPAVRAVEERLERRGWLAVGSLRLIPVVPFSLVNYASGLSSVRPAPYFVASVLGSAPGTAAVVFLGDALAGKASPVLIVVSGALFAVGVVGLIIDSRTPVRPAASRTRA
ncbi:MAG: TVP38/TMEM64 family protein [Gordonia sp. (in: high G+C Gram-positive bacteria)]|uniref:TVP38/TMEM64 family protein n=1 Tax=Gordonia sp. (in: high G+C Gram-positive bacteria) TaxID=84139 RepID=UPI003BB7E4F3